MAIDPAYVKYELLTDNLTANWGPEMGLALNQISGLFEQGLGEGYYLTDELVKLVAGGGAIICAWDSLYERYVGAVTVYEMRCKEADEDWDTWSDDPLFPGCQAETPESFSGVVLLESASVAPHARGHGIGMELYKRRILWAWARPNVHAAVGYSWRSGKNESLGLHKALGGVEGKTKTGVFAGMPCTKCGPSCECPATLVVFDKPAVDIDGDAL